MDGNLEKNQEIAESSGVPIVVLDRFIQSTRDSGYKDTTSAISELVDNALQANAKNVSIKIEKLLLQKSQDYRVSIVDDGDGMDGETLSQALRFGGTTRFNDRSGLGRFGMGLPNASLSQARRVEVYSWQFGREPLCSYLDVDEIVSRKLDFIPIPIEQAVPEGIEIFDAASGTAVVWQKCDRLDNTRISTIERKLSAALGRKFRYYLWEGISISINGKSILAIDPLYLKPQENGVAASKFEETISFEVYASPNSSNGCFGKVDITFSELPVHAWKDCTNEEKRKMGVSNGAGVSIVRGGREVDFGWFFMGTKRRENYDDWWRCEVKFDPVLDDAFGITHTKQQIRPKEHLVEGLQSYIEETAKTLNSRVRGQFSRAKENASLSAAEEIATKRDSRLKPLPPSKTRVADSSRLDNLKRKYPELQTAAKGSKNFHHTDYRIVEDEFETSNFYEPLNDSGSVIAVINSRHIFARRLYSPLKAETNSDLSQALQLMLLSAARADATFSKKSERDVLERFRAEWSSTLEALLKP